MPVPTTEQMLKVWQKATAGTSLQDVPRQIREGRTSTGRRGGRRDGRRTTRKPKIEPFFEEAIEEIQKAKEEAGVPPTPLERKAQEIVRPPTPQQIIDTVSRQPAPSKKVEPEPTPMPDVPDKPKRMGTVNINNQTYYLMKYGKGDYRVHDVRGNLISGSHKTKYDANMWIIDPSGETQIVAPTVPSDYKTTPTVVDYVGERMEETPPDEAPPMYETPNYYGTTPTVDKKKAEIFEEKQKGHLIDMKLEKKHYIGTDPDTGERIYIHESPYQVEHGYTPVDPDFKLAVLNIDSDIKDTRSVIKQIQNIIPLARENIKTLEDNLAIVKGSHANARFEVDKNADGVITPDEILTKNETVAYIKSQIKYNKNIIDYEKDIPKYQEQIDRLENVKGIVKKYKELGYEMDISDTGEYEFKHPDPVDVFKWRYGKHAPVQMTASAFMQSPLAIETVVDIVAGGGEGQKRELAEFGLGIESSLRHRGFGDYALRTYVGSPAMIEGVWTPLGTMALGYGMGGIASRVGSSAGSIGGKLSGALAKFTPAGQKIIKQTYTYGKVLATPLAKAGKVSAKFFSTRSGQVASTGGLFALIEIPGAVEVLKRDPSQLPGHLARRGFAWGISVMSFKKGMELYKAKHPVKPKDKWKYLPDDEGKFRDVTTQRVDSDISMMQQEIKTDPTKFTYIYEGRHPKFKTYDLTGGGYEKLSNISDDVFGVQFKGYQIQADKEIQILTESGFKTLKPGESISFGRGLVTQTKNILTKETASKVFSFYSIGKEIQVKGIVDPKGIIPRIFVSKTVTTPHGGTPIFTEGRGVFETGYRGATEIYTVDTSLKTMKFAKPSDISKYLFAGQYKPTGFDIGLIRQTGAVSTIKLDAPTKIIPDISKGLLKSKEAVASLVKPTTKVDYSVLFGVSSGAREIVASLPSTTEMFSKTTSNLLTSSVNLYTPVAGVLTMRSKPETVQPLHQKVINIQGSKIDIRQKLEIKNILDTGEITEQERRTDYISTTKPITEIGIESELLPETGIITDNLLESEQDQSVKQVTGLRLDLALASQQDYSQVLITSPTLSIVPPTPGIPVPVPIPVLLPETPQATIRKQILKGKGKGFNVYVKERTMFHGEIKKPTRFIKINREPLSRKDALGLGGTVVDNTSAISFKIKSAKEKAQPLDVKTDKWENISHKFDQKGDVLIEKTRHRIDTKGEIREISLLGAKSNLLKGSNKKIDILKKKGVKNVRYY
jgi:hypothetical protein